MNFSVEHLAIPALDPVALKDWYVRVLGARTIWENNQPPVFLIVLPSRDFDPSVETQPALTEGIWLEIYTAETPLPNGGDNKLAGFRHLALRVDSLDTAKMELEKSGVKFAGEIRPAAGGGRVVFFADREGNLLHLVERPAGSSLR